MALRPYAYLKDIYTTHVTIEEVKREEFEIPQVDIVLSLKYNVTVKYRMSLIMYKDTETYYDLQKHVIDKLNRLVVEKLLN